MVTQKVLEGDIKANITLLRKCIKWRAPDAKLFLCTAFCAVGRRNHRSPKVHHGYPIL
jgi:hypothetical protein